MDISVELANEVFANESQSLWVFAYGSLCWKPGFKFHKAATGFVKGYERKFWQGNTTHRGTEDKPGRVATLIEHKKGKVYGVAFSVSGDAAIPYLSRRECELGGYNSQFTTFYPIHGKPFKVLAYVAVPQNRHWMGDAKEKDIALQIVECEGPSGHNVEYLLRLANFMREHFSNHHDAHLYNIEKEVLILIKEKNMCLKTLMGSGEGCVSFVKKDGASSDSENSQNETEGERAESYQYTSRIQGTKLRCLNL